MNAGAVPFDETFKALTGFAPMAWQRRLFVQFAAGEIPSALDIPTGLGKTSVMVLWLIARACGANLPRRCVYVVDRRAVVDQATTEAEKLRAALEGEAKHFDTLSEPDRIERKRLAAQVKSQLGLAERAKLPISTLRGAHVDNREWLDDPAAPAIIVGTVDMIGSRLLFSGYGVSPKMRPYHAGLLGADTLVVLDEAHLVPPFEKLLGAIGLGTATLGPGAAEDRKTIPPFRPISLSATGRQCGGEAFRLRDDDLEDGEIRKRLDAKKTVELVDLGEKKLEDAIAGQAWRLADNGNSPIRALVYCDSREIAKKVEAAIRGLAKGDRKQGIAEVRIETELFVGARRVKERADAMRWLTEAGFVNGEAVSRTMPTFLIATSAGEVGVDMDADHMICDLVPWERMVQRVGRVNRRGAGDARIVIVHGGEPKPKKADQPTAKEKRDAIAWRSLNVIAQLPKNGTDASPGALRELKQRAEHDESLSACIDAATTPPPLRPALTRALVDAWSMTSLEKHTGRPEIDSWLRGWIEDDAPQTRVVWRVHLPVRVGDTDIPKDEIEGFFEAAPPHLSEQLEAETWRVVDWLIERAEAVSKHLARDKTDEADDEAAHALEFEQDKDGLRKRLAGNDIVAFVLTRRRELQKSFRLDELDRTKDKKKLKEQLESDLSGATLVVDYRLAGLTGGILDAGSNDVPRTADDGKDWIEIKGRSVVRFRIRLDDTSDATDDEWRESFRFDIERSADGDPVRWLVIDGPTEERRAESRRPQLLDEHQSWAAAKARDIAKGVGLTDVHADMLALAARLHDEGKRSPRWQHAFNARRDGIYAKTKGPVKLALLDGYRHEFGSLPYATQDAAFGKLQVGSPDLADLVLHLIASHHGGARPLISTRSCEDAPPSALAERAQDVALRFARLQKRWGPWGLAWWEALLRASDQQASRENDQAGKADG